MNSHKNVASIMMDGEHTLKSSTGIHLVSMNRIAKLTIKYHANINNLYATV
jgi:hypothetical protein